MSTHSILRRFAAGIAVILLAAAGLGLAPIASAASGDTSLNIEFEIQENDTVDFTMVMRDDDAGSSSNCDASNIEDRFGDGIKINAKSGDGGNSCTITIKDLTLKQVSGSLLADIRHEGDFFTFKMYSSSRSFDHRAPAHDRCAYALIGEDVDDVGEPDRLAVPGLLQQRELAAVADPHRAREARPQARH